MTADTQKSLPALPIGTHATGTRIESDSMGQIEVPAEHYLRGPDAFSVHQERTTTTLPDARPSPT